MKDSLYLDSFYTVSFKFSVKSNTGKSQRVRDKTYKVLNLISRCASSTISMDICMDLSMDISMDLSMDIHIHGKPGNPLAHWR